MKALQCILAAFVLAVAIPQPADAYSPILTVLKAKKKPKQPKKCVPSPNKKCPPSTEQNKAKKRE